MHTIIDYGMCCGAFQCSSEISIQLCLCFRFVFLNVSQFSERQRRYRIMREHGLLLPNHTRSWMGKVSDALCLQNGKPTTAGRFIASMQLTTGLAFDKCVEARQYEHDLRKFIFKWVFRFTISIIQIKLNHL